MKKMTPSIRNKKLMALRKKQGYKTFEGLVRGDGKPKDMWSNENN
jgi:hypothetical protein